MFAAIKNLIPEPRQADQPRHYVGRHRKAEAGSADGAIADKPIDESATAAA
jgi:hypothetical protein